MKICVLALAACLCFSCAKEYSYEGDELRYCPLVLDSTGFENERVGLYEVNGWNIPVHSSITAYDPISGTKSLYGYFLQGHAWLAETREFQLMRYLNIKFKYRLYENTESQDLKYKITLNGEVLVENSVIQGETQFFDQTFDIAVDKGKIGFIFFQEGTVGRNVWIDDVVISTAQLCK